MKTAKKQSQYFDSDRLDSVCRRLLPKWKKQSQFRMSKINVNICIA